MLNINGWLNGKKLGPFNQHFYVVSRYGVLFHHWSVYLPLGLFMKGLHIVIYITIILYDYAWVENGGGRIWSGENIKSIN